MKLATLAMCCCFVASGWCSTLEGKLLPSTVKPDTEKRVRIRGGSAIDIDQAPHQVSLQTSSGEHVCGGSIIGRRWILTAAHCLYRNNGKVKAIRAGSSDRGRGGQVVKIARYIIHPRYDHDAVDYDFALLALRSDLALTGTGAGVRPIGLPAANETVGGGALCFVSGWGDTHRPNESSRVLRGATVFTVEQRMCRTLMARYFPITPAMLCAGLPDGGKDSCNGDSGGPLVWRDKLIGVVSFGRRCGFPLSPGVYGRVSAAREWIQQTSGI